MSSQDLPMAIEIDRLNFTEPWPAKSFSYELGTNYSICLVAVDDSDLVLAEIVVWVIVDEAHVATIAVHPEHQGKGIASALLAEALIQAMERVASASLLEVRPSNTAALKLYQRFGYETVGVRKEYYQDNKEDALLLNLFELNLEKLRNVLTSKNV